MGHGPHPVAHRIAGQHLFERQRVGEARGGKAHGENVGEAGQRPVGAAHDGVLLVQDARNAEKARRHEGREGRVAAKADDGIGAHVAQLLPGHGHAAQDSDATAHELDRIAQRRRCRRHDVHLPGGKVPAIGFDAMVGHQLDGMAAADEFLCQGHGREEMSSRAARHESEGLHSAGATTALR